MGEITVIDADSLVMGRLASEVASRILAGEEIHVINAEKAVLSGDRRDIVQRYKDKRDKGTPRKGPYHPRTPDRILKRSIRGMVPDQKPRGREALERLRVFMGVPEDLADAEAETVEDARRPDIVSYITLAELSEGLGYEVKVDT